MVIVLDGTKPRVRLDSSEVIVMDEGRIKKRSINGGNLSEFLQKLSSVSQITSLNIN